MLPGQTAQRSSVHETGGTPIQRARDAAFTTDVVTRTVSPYWDGDSDLPLSDNTTYFYRLRALYTIGTSPWSNTAQATTPASTLPPTGPQPPDSPQTNPFMPQRPFAPLPPTTPRRADAKLRISSAKLDRRGRTLTVRGTATRGVTGKVKLTVELKTGRRTRRINKTVKPKAGKLTAKVKLPKTAWRTARVRARYAGNSKYLPGSTSRSVRRGR